MAFAVCLTACGGSDDAAPAVPAAGSAAPLVITNAVPATRNGTYSKTGVLFESNSSNGTLTTFNDSDDHCRVAAYGLVNSGDSVSYYIEVAFKKSDRTVSFVKYGLNDGSLTLLARNVANPGVTVDIAARRITFTNAALLTPAQPTINGTLEYPTNAVAANRAACG